MAKEAVQIDDEQQLDEAETGAPADEASGPRAQAADVPPADDSDLPDYLLRKGDAMSGQVPVSQQMRIVEAVLFAASGPLSEADIAEALPGEVDVAALLADIQENYHMRGVNLVQVAGKWAFRTAEDLSFLLRKETTTEKRLSRAALEVLAIIAYHQPVTRSEVEEIRGVATSKGSLDALMEIGWIRMRGRRRTPGRPVTYGTTPEFLEQFGLNEVRDLPGMAELKGAGLLSSNVPADMFIPSPSDDDALGPDEDPLEDDEFEPELEMAFPEEDDVSGGEPEEALEMNRPEVLDE